ncbi:MAG: hypothetical protein ACT4TC_13785 [Myxococcaceae bacterium]
MHPLLEQAIRSLGSDSYGAPAFRQSSLSAIQHQLSRCVGKVEYGPVLDSLVRFACSIRQSLGGEGAAKQLLSALSAVVEVASAQGHPPSPAAAAAWQSELL